MLGFAMRSSATPWRQPSRPGLSSLRGSATRSGTSGLVRLPRSSGVSMTNGSATGSKKSVRNTHATLACPWIRLCRTVVEPSTVSRSLERRYQRTRPAIKEMRREGEFREQQERARRPLVRIAQPDDIGSGRLVSGRRRYSLDYRPSDRRRWPQTYATGLHGDVRAEEV